MNTDIKEYGGYIEFEYFKGKVYHENAIALNSGRHCVEYLIRTKHIKKLFLPYFLCTSVKEMCDKLNVQVDFYHTDMEFMPICRRHFDGQDWLYIVNYYGQLSNEMLIEMKNKYGNIIVDNVQAFFQMPVKGIDTIYSCRKFFGVADGGYLYTDTILEEEIERDFSLDRMAFLFGRMEKTASEFYPQYVSNNKLFEKEPMKLMSRTTENIMRALDYKYICKTRTENFTYLQDQLYQFNRLSLKVPEGAFMYPLYLSDGSKIRKHLQKEKIYIPILWPDVFGTCQPMNLEYDMAENILPLPVDQRYTREDMEYIVGRVNSAILAANK